MHGHRAPLMSLSSCRSCRYQLMSLVDGSNSQVYKQKLKDVEKSAIKKAPGDSAYMALSDL